MEEQKTLLSVEILDEAIGVHFECKSQKEIASVAASLAHLFRSEETLFLLTMMMLGDEDLMTTLDNRTFSSEDIDNIFKPKENK